MVSTLTPPQGQSHSTKMKVQEEFEKLRRYLKTEEANVLASLQQEEAQKISVVQGIMEMSRDTFSMSDSVRDMEKVTRSCFLKVRPDLRLPSGSANEMTASSSSLHRTSSLRWKGSCSFVSMKTPPTLNMSLIQKVTSF